MSAWVMPQVTYFVARGFIPARLACRQFGPVILCEEEEVGEVDVVVGVEVETRVVGGIGAGGEEGTGEEEEVAEADPAVGVEVAGGGAESCDDRIVKGLRSAVPEERWGHQADLRAGEGGRRSEAEGAQQTAGGFGANCH